MRKILLILLVIILTITFLHTFDGLNTTIKAASDIKVEIDGELQEFSQSPVIINGSTLVPMREIFEALGAKVTWNGQDQSVTAKKFGKSIYLKIGANTATVNGKEILLTVKAQLVNGSTYVPLRFVSETLGASVNWDSSTKTISILINKTYNLAYEIVQQTVDGGYILAGQHSFNLAAHNGVGSEDGLLIKVDEEGKEIWSKTYGGTGIDTFHFMEKTKDGGYILVGRSYSYNDRVHDVDGWVLKVDEEGNELWSKVFGGSGGDYLNSVQQTKDGGYILVGKTSFGTFGGSEGWIIKIDNSGQEIWSKTFGGHGSDNIQSVQQTDDGGYMLAGDTSSFSDKDYIGRSNYDGWLIKVDEKGNEVWSKIFGGSDDDYINAMQQTNDGGYILTGYTKNKGWLIKVDETGQELWSKTYIGNSIGKFSSMDQTADGGYILVGETSEANFIKPKGWVVKIDYSGQELWSKSISGTDLIKSVKQTKDSGYILVGASSDFHKRNDLLIKIKEPSQDNWSKTYGNNYNDQIYSMQKTIDDGYILAGNTSSSNVEDDTDGWLIKTDINGQKLWSRTYGSENGDVIYSVQLTKDLGYILAGFTEDSKLWLIKVDEMGNELWSQSFVDGYNDLNNYLQVKVIAQQTDDGGFILAGSINNDGFSDGTLIKTDKNGQLVWSKIFGGKGNDVISSILPIENGGYILTGYTESFGNKEINGWLIKVDNEGNELWSNTFSSEDINVFTSVLQTGDGGYILSGYKYFVHNSNVEFSYSWLVKTDEMGKEVWSKSYNSNGKSNQYYVTNTMDGGYMLAGTVTYGYDGDLGDLGDLMGIDFGEIMKSESNINLIKTDENGEEIWSTTFSGNNNEVVSSIQQTKDGGYVLAGYSDSFGEGGYNGWLIKADETGNVSSPIIQHISANIIFQ